MSEFQHSIVLFTGDDGLPLEFNVRNTNDKAHLKELIEHGGGFCTQSDNAVHLISPGTKVLNVDLGKKLVSSSYIHDCVKQNYLLDVNDYVFTISQAQTSDISDEDSERLLAQRQSTFKSPIKNPAAILKMNKDISPIKALNNETGSTTTSNLTIPSSNSALPLTSNSSSTHSESFVEGSQEASSNIKISHLYYGNLKNIHKSTEVLLSPLKLVNSNVESGSNFPDFQSQSLVSHVKSPESRNAFSSNSPVNNLQYDDRPASMSPILSASPVEPMDICNEANVTSPHKRSANGNINISPFATSPQKKLTKVNDENLVTSPKTPKRSERYTIKLPAVIPSPVKPIEENSTTAYSDRGRAPNSSPIHTVVSSSQPEDNDDLDQFDNMLLNKIQKNPQQLEEEDESLSQSYTVSSSADAQMPSKPSSVEKESQDNDAALPDSPNINESQVNEVDYIKNLETEVEEILQKSSPKSIQDKIALVKYICCARKLLPSTVLESLTKSLDL